MKKIGICTLYFANNFGAILQAFSLQEVLKNMGHEVEFIKLKEFFDNSKDRDIKCFNRSKESLNICKEIYNKDEHKYDAIIVGSDELWNVKNGSFEHLEEYFGYGLNSKMIASYAPSANGVSKEELREFYNNKIDFSKFNKLSARDKMTKELIESFSEKKAELVLDPTLLVDSFEKYIKYPDKNEKDYIVIYGYKFTEEEKNKILKFANENNKKIYSLGFRKDWCENLDIDIFEFLGYMKNADYCITNTFHGLLFSMILEKEFVIFPRDNVKVIDVMERFQIEDRNGMISEDLKDIFASVVDYQKINKIKLQKREESLKYLKSIVE